MAEFCKECFIKKIIVPSDSVSEDMLIMSKYSKLCEGCCGWKPVVVGIKGKPYPGIVLDTKETIQ